MSSPLFLDPEFLYKMVDYTRSIGDEESAKKYHQDALRLDMLWGLVKLFEWMHSKPESKSCIRIPHPGTNRRERRAMKAKEKQFAKLTPKELNAFFEKHKSSLTRV